MAGISHGDRTLRHTALKPETAAHARPNFLVILADDLGCDDLGAYGNALARTPVLDALARRSVVFDDFTVNPVCAPSRATLMTGRHFLRTGVSHVHGGKDFLHLDEMILPQFLRRAGYATGMWGKWHLGDAPGYHPWERGFDEAWSARLYRHFPAEGRWNGRPVPHEGWADAAMVNYAIDFIDRHREGPWLAYLPTMSPHSPLRAPEEFVAPHRGPGVSEALATLRGMISHLDHQLGRLFAHLDATGLTENTVILFLSDNGPARETGALSDADREARKIAGRRGWKGDIWENGVRSPLLVKQGARWTPRRAPTPVAMEDMLPTLLELAGLPPEPGTGERARDGASLLPVLERRRGAEAARTVFNYANPGWPPGDRPYDPDGTRDEYRPVSADERERLPGVEQVISVRRGPWKFARNPDVNTRLEHAEASEWLLNLQEDPGEMMNMIEDAPLVADKLRCELDRWWEDVRSEPHAFSAPEFFLPGEESDALSIPAKTACALADGLRNTVTVLKGWTRAGQAADYHIRINEPCAAEVAIRLARPLSMASVWRVSARVGEREIACEYGIAPGEIEGVARLPLDFDTVGAGALRIELIGLSVGEEAWLEALTLAPRLRTARRPTDARRETVVM